MRLLLDTHALLWWWEGSDRLSLSALNTIGEADAVFVSPVSLWEIATKVGTGKLHPAIPVDRMEDAVASDGFFSLDIVAAHGVHAGSYPLTHRDPFDRMLAAQAELEDLTLVTRDPAFAAFPCKTAW